MLKVTIAEVSRSLTRNVGVNLQGFGNNFSFAQGRDFINDAGIPTYSAPGTTAVGRVLNVLGVDVDGRGGSARAESASSPSWPNRPSPPVGETASFLAAANFPIPDLAGARPGHDRIPPIWRRPRLQPDGAREWPHLHAGPPGVSELSSPAPSSSTVSTCPSLTTRRAETTVELGSAKAS
jgi:pilus assembly protein CpaC